MAATSLVLSIRGPIRREDLEGLSARVCATFGAIRPAEALCDVAGVCADAVTVDALARLQLAAARYRCRITLANASADLRELVVFMGLRDVLPG